MRNQYPGDGDAFMMFRPPVHQVAPRDAARLLATDPDRNAVSIDRITLDGAVPSRRSIDEAVDVTFDAGVT